jgi:hypothetical protein
MEEGNGEWTVCEEPEVSGHSPVAQWIKFHFKFFVLLKYNPLLEHKPPVCGLDLFLSGKAKANFQAAGGIGRWEADQGITGHIEEGGLGRQLDRAPCQVQGPE